MFPLSNWTELDVWLYIHVENIPVVPLYFAEEREVVVRGESIVPIYGKEQLLPGEKSQRLTCRMRSLGCMPCSGAIRSEADTIPKIIRELLAFRRSERENRVIDHDEEGSMEIEEAGGILLMSLAARACCRTIWRRCWTIISTRTCCALRPPAAWTTASPR